MAADRQFPTSGTGADYMAKMALECTTLYNAACLPLTAAGGTADDPACTCTPALTAGVLAGMSFWWTATATNTGPMTMAIDGNAPVSLKNDDGSDLAAGVIKAGRRYLLTAAGGVLIATGTVNIQKVDDYQAFTAPGASTWYKPAGTPDAALVTGKMWAGGGGGSASTSNSRGGGGGGGYLEWTVRAGDLSSSVSLTVGAGGAAGGVGGNTVFGDYTVYGGGAGIGGGQAGSGGAGGGVFKAGGNGSSANDVADNTDIGDPTAGFGGGGTFTPANGRSGGNGYFGGGGGGGSGGNGNNGGAGGKSFRGGGGGGGRGTGTAGGTSIFGGNGGGSGVAGQPRGGGGGANAPGGRGEIIIHVIG